MQPDQRLKQADGASGKLSSVVRSRQVTQLLQGPPPAQPTTAQQTALASCSISQHQLHEALPEDVKNESEIAAAAQLLQRVLRRQPGKKCRRTAGVAAEAAAAAGCSAAAL